MSLSAYAKFNAVVILSAITSLVMGGVGLLVLDKAGHLPSPPLTATNCIDEKFQFVRDKAPDRPSLLAVGSSVTWRNLDFSVLDEAQRDAAQPLNGAPCFLHIHETAFLTQFYLDNLPSVRTVLSVFAMRDFATCAGDGTFFDADDARRYVFGGWPGWPLYFKNLRPRSFLSDMRNIKGMRSGADRERPLVMDQWGSGPFDITPPQVRYDTRSDPACLGALAAMQRELEARGVRWVVVLLPPMPAWLQAYDPGGQRDAAWRSAMTQTLAGSETTLIDGRAGFPVQNEDFTDPAHFHWSKVAGFTRWVFEQAGQPGMDTL